MTYNLSWVVVVVPVVLCALLKEFWLPIRPESLSFNSSTILPFLLLPSYVLYLIFNSFFLVLPALPGLRQYTNHSLKHTVTYRQFVTSTPPSSSSSTSSSLLLHRWPPNTQNSPSKCHRNAPLYIIVQLRESNLSTLGKR